jgi:putative restriction endonuclease
MSDKTLAYYVKAFTSLRRDYKFGGAPHKPILLLSILTLIDEGKISDNKIYITPELVGQFKSYWNLLVSTPHTPNFSLPFYHLINEKGEYWKLRRKPGIDLPLAASKSVKSFRSLTESLDYAYFDERLFMLLTDKSPREILKQAILEKYFPDRINEVRNDPVSYLTELEVQFLKEPPQVYLKRLNEINSENAKEEEVFMRGAVFKREIPKLYNGSCAITRLRVDTVENISMVDACHIDQFAGSGDDTVQNGIALCPNRHRAFDRGLIAIDRSYRVLVSNTFTESTSSYSLSQFEGREILLPSSHEHYPSQEKLEKHRRRFNFQ